MCSPTWDSLGHPYHQAPDLRETPRRIDAGFAYVHFRAMSCQCQWDRDFMPFRPSIQPRDITGLLRGRIVIPIHNASGVLIAYAGRTIDGHEPKYRFPAGFRKSLVLFNLHRALATKTRTVVVVEGFFDTIAVHQAGYPVVGLMDSTLSRHQADLLAGHFDRVVLMLDGDEAGRQGALRVAATLGAHMSVSVVALDDGRQPDQLALGQTQHLLSSNDVGETKPC